jgi:integrase
MPETSWPVAIAAVKFLALTGWRRGEMLALKWAEVDLATRTARLADTKTGASLRPLSHAACDVLRELPHLGELVFPASTGGIDGVPNDDCGAQISPDIVRHARRCHLGSDLPLRQRRNDGSDSRQLSIQSRL